MNRTDSNRQSDQIRSTTPGKVINITSFDALRLNPWDTYSYHASKSALIYITKRMAPRLITDPINVTSIAPGAFVSETNRAARDHGEEVARSIPARRMGVDEDVAGTAIYLASRADDYVAVDTIAVGGGLVHAAVGPASTHSIRSHRDRSSRGGLSLSRSRLEGAAPAAPSRRHFDAFGAPRRAARVERLSVSWR